MRLAQVLLCPLALANVPAHRSKAAGLAGGVGEGEDSVDHPKRFARLEVPEADFQFAMAIPQHLREELLHDEGLIFGEEELPDLGLKGLLQVVQSNQTHPGLVDKEWLELRVAHADELVTVLRPVKRSGAAALLPACAESTAKSLASRGSIAERRSRRKPQPCYPHPPR